MFGKKSTSTSNKVTFSILGTFPHFSMYLPFYKHTMLLQIQLLKNEQFGNTLKEVLFIKYFMPLPPGSSECYPHTAVSPH